jgi:hypothetical protein
MTEVNYKVIQICELQNDLVSDKTHQGLQGLTGSNGV